MTYSRFFIQFPLKPYYISQQAVTLPVDTSHYMQRVLRLRLADKVTVFDGLGGEYTAEICTVTKKTLSILLLAHDNIERESSLKTTLVQAISKPEHMDFSIQKAVELGVTEIVPLITTRSPALKAKVLEKRHGHWQKIIFRKVFQQKSIFRNRKIYNYFDSKYFNGKYFDENYVDRKIS